ncbi:transcriptional regulator [Pediococcus stilesii]|uniref:transcriptional regulator n=1 Tax=Pediococcus stilesii TaxID=331679 RepID=UPI0020788397|nr:transcriptional regulator [Pediococcus stilesii]
MKDSLEALDLISKKRQEVIKKSCREANGTPADWKISNFLKDEFLSIQDLSKISGLDISTLSRQVKRSAEKKLIMRLPGQSRKFQTTKKGAIFRSYVNEQVQLFDQKLFENWSDEELSMLNILTNRILKNALK